MTCLGSRLSLLPESPQAATPDKSSGQPANKPSRQEQERQACDKLVLSSPITSWVGQQRAVRPWGWIVFLRREPDPAAHTGNSPCKALCPALGPCSPQIAPVARKEPHNTPTRGCQKAASFCRQRFLPSDSNRNVQRTGGTFCS